MTTSICIATYQRPDRLRLLLEDLCAQDTPIHQVIVVDNDASGSARQVITAIQERGCPFSLDYAIQPLRNIALTRNRTVELASGEWIAFVDDDERAPAEWLGRLLAAAAHYRADGVLGPVEPRLPANAPAWIQRGRFYDFPRMATGDPVPLNRMRFGNVVLRGSLLRAEPGPFDPHYGLTTGEDADLLIRLDTKGARIIWCDEAVVVEPIEPARLSLRWLVMRALSGGQEFARKAVGGRYGAIGLRGRMLLLAKSSAQLLAAAGLAGVSWPLGRHVAAGWLIRAAANLGKISVVWGWRYDEYA